MTATDTAWIVPGADVLRFYDGKRGAPTSSRRDVIAKVAAKSFTIEGDDYRYTLSDRPTARGVSNAYMSQIRIVPLDSDEARRVIAAEHVASLKAQAVRAGDEWRVQYGSGDIDAAIDALTALRDAL